MTDTESAPVQEQLQAPQKAVAPPKQVIASKVTGTVKWFNVKSGYGFINRNDTKEDVFVHQSAIAKNNPKKAVRSVGDGEVVEFDVVVGEKGNEASNVTGPNGEAVKGSPYAADKRRGFRYWYPRRRRGTNSKKIENGVDSGDNEGGPKDDDPDKLKQRTRRFRRFPSGGRGRFSRGGYGGYRRGPRPNNQGQPGDGENMDNNDGSDGGQGGPRRNGGGGRRFFRRNFRGGRGGMRRGGGPRRGDFNPYMGGGGGVPNGDAHDDHERRRRPRRGRRGGNRSHPSESGQNKPAGEKADGQPVQNTTTESTA